MHDESQEAAVRTGRGDNEVESVSIGIAAGLFELAHLHRDEGLFRMPALPFTNPLPNSLAPHS